MKDDLFYEGDALADLPEKVTKDHFIGCPLDWFKRVLPVVHGKNELAVALFVYRLHRTRGNPVLVSNKLLSAELGIDRFIKYRALRRLADAGIVRIKSHGTGPASSVEVTVLPLKRERKKVRS